MPKDGDVALLMSLKSAAIQVVQRKFRMINDVQKAKDEYVKLRELYGPYMTAQELEDFGIDVKKYAKTGTIREKKEARVHIPFVSNEKEKKKEKEVVAELPNGDEFNPEFAEASKGVEFNEDAIK